MTILNIIDKKQKNIGLTEEEINFCIAGMIDGTIKDCQIKKLLTSIGVNGLNDDEVFYLTDAMIKSGDVIDLSSIEGIKFDQQTIGDVKDKITPILIPLLATFGLKIAKTNIRNMGYEGFDENLCSIPGYQIELTTDEFIKQINEIGAAITLLPDMLVPVYEKLHNLKTYNNSIPLLAASVMSKKIASGADYILVNIEVGNSSLIKSYEEARELARTMIKIGNKYNKKTLCVLIDINKPLGFAIGNALEVKETIATLKGMGPSDILELVIELAGTIVSSALEFELEEAKIQCFKKINNGEAYKKFEELVGKQHGNLSKLEVSNKIISFRTSKSGYINYIDVKGFDLLAHQIGAIRTSEKETINYSVGIVLTKKNGDYVEANDELARFFLVDKDVRLNDIWACYKIDDAEINQLQSIYEIIK